MVHKKEFTMIKYLTIAFFFLSGLSAQAQTNTSATCGVNSSYVGNTDGVKYDDNPAFNCSLDVSNENGFYAGVWATDNFRDEPGFGKEVNLYGGLDAKVSGFDVNVEIAYYALFGADAVTMGGTISKQFGNVSPYVTAQTYAPIESGEFEAGEIYRAGVVSTVYGYKRGAVNLDTGIIYDTGPFSNPKGTSASVVATVEHELSDSLLANVEVAGFVPLSADKEENFYVGVSFTKTF